MLVNKSMVVAFVIHGGAHVCWDCFNNSCEPSFSICTGESIRGHEVMLCAYCRCLLAYNDSDPDYDDCSRWDVECSHEHDEFSTPRDGDIVTPPTLKDDEPIKTSNLNTAPEPAN